MGQIILELELLLLLLPYSTIFDYTAPSLYKTNTYSLSFIRNRELATKKGSYQRST